MKLIMESWKRFINESEEKNYKGPPLDYSSVVLNHISIFLNGYHGTNITTNGG